MLIILNGLHPGELSIFTKDASCGQKLRELVQVAACRPLILSMLSKLQPSDLDDHERWRRILLSIEDRHAGINVLIRVITKGLWKRPRAGEDPPARAGREYLAPKPKERPVKGLGLLCSSVLRFSPSLFAPGAAPKARPKR